MNEEKLLIVVDMVNGFVREGAMADPYIEHIIPEIKRLVENNKSNKTIFIKDCHEEDAVEFLAYPKHCLKGTSESELVDELKEFETKENTYEKKFNISYVCRKFFRRYFKNGKSKRSNCCWLLY